MAKKNSSRRGVSGRRPHIGNAPRFDAVRALIAGFSPHFWVVSLLLALLFVTGGSSRYDTLSNLFLWPLGVIATAFGLATLRRGAVRENRVLLGLAGAVVLLGLLYLVPLPPVLWQSASSMRLVLEVDRATGQGDIWRSLSIAPDMTQGAFFSLFPVLAVLVNGVSIPAGELRHLAVVVLISIVFTGLLTILQLSGPGNGIFYFYGVTNEGAAVGMFANRNHHAIYLAAAIPVLAVFAGSAARSHALHRRRQFLAAGAGVLILPIVLVSGSRAGFGLCVLGLLSVPILYWLSRPRRSRDSRKDRGVSRKALIGLGVGGAGILALIGWAVLSGRSESLFRIAATGDEVDRRFHVWPVVWAHLREVMPWGVGPGAYEVGFRAIEPDALLRPSYSNHAHNDWLELVYTCGVPGVLVLLAALIALSVAIVHLARASRGDGTVAWGWAGVASVMCLGIGSFFDYPLRVPSIAAFFVIACLWIAVGARSPSRGRGAV
jgi:O-antigen ligase